MIESFRHKGLRLFYERGDGSKLPAEMLPRIRLILSALQATQTIEGMNNPLFRLHPLKGKLAALLGGHGARELADCFSV